MRILHQASSLSGCRTLQDNEQLGELLLINAEKEEAENIVDLIHASLIILIGFPDNVSMEGHCLQIPDDPIELEDMVHYVFQTDGFFQKFIWREELVAAVALAAKAWSNPKLVYAIHKLARSYWTESVSPHSMHPMHAQIFEKHSESFASHVGTSVAINLAFSAIEELGFKINSSAERNRWLKNSTFDWNPLVLKDIQNRLENKNINPSTIIDWVVRGDQTEIKYEPLRDNPAKYSDGENVRDIALLLPDAISMTGYLRDRKTAHAFSKDSALLGPYEVYNCQQVARFLILSSCEMFNVFTDELRLRFLK